MPWTLATVTALLVFLLAGCGESGEGSGSEPGPTSEGKPERPAQPRRIRFESPAVGPGGAISPRVNCGQGSIWLPLKWGPPPGGTEELVVYLGRFYRDGSGLRVPFGIFITNIDPSTRSIPANTLPPGSSWNFEGVESCPERRGQYILLQLFALGRPAPIAGLTEDALVGLTRTALGLGSSAEAPPWLDELTEGALARGRIVATYGRVRSR
jgi:hypothetical protein